MSHTVRLSGPAVVFIVTTGSEALVMLPRQGGNGVHQAQRLNLRALFSAPLRHVPGQRALGRRISYRLGLQD
jgi:hypothetical protein